MALDSKLKVYRIYLSRLCKIQVIQVVVFDAIKFLNISKLEITITNDLVEALYPNFSSCNNSTSNSDCNEFNEIVQIRPLIRQSTLAIKQSLDLSTILSSEGEIQTSI